MHNHNEVYKNHNVDMQNHYVDMQNHNVDIQSRNAYNVNSQWRYEKSCRTEQNHNVDM